ncbi:unnamed protein product [Macrosiphum euphorbiae]|uniref:Uncharacterized protein n=1 Tax=Macrosiphum euphorbiae TaxID=13131 RepID=A0AAV0WI66_9HEMI|nr:unnamed protein product [Macrosiphum euphorbiae]
MWSTQLTKLNEIKTTIPWTTVTQYKRQEATLNKLQLGHTWSIHRAQIPAEPDEFHTPGEILTLKHIICHRQNYSNIRANLEITGNLQEALGPEQAT